MRRTGEILGYVKKLLSLNVFCIKIYKKQNQGIYPIPDSEVV